MFPAIAYFNILGRSVISWLGILTLTLFLATGIVGYLRMKGKRYLPLKTHYTLAIVATCIALLHGFIGIMI